MGRIRILIADDHAVLRTGLRMLIDSQRDLEVVGEASDGDEAVRKAAALRPDIALVTSACPDRAERVPTSAPAC
jgi:DNA-binding NarL/FixJ family response regulator